MIWFGHPGARRRVLRRHHLRHRRCLVARPRDHRDRRRHLRPRLARDELGHERAHRRARVRPLTPRPARAGRPGRSRSWRRVMYVHLHHSARVGLALYDAAVPRVVLIVNPYSSGVTRQPRRRTSRLRSRGVPRWSSGRPSGRGHAVELAAEAAERRRRASSSSRATAPTTRRSTAPPGRLPFGFLPGGGASVFPRALGLPRDPVAAASGSVEALEAGRTTSISLGRVNGRRFCFSAGIGLDAEAVRRIDRRGPRSRRTAGRATRSSRRPSSAILIESRFRMRAAARDRRLRPRRVRCFVANGRPYTYAGPAAGDDRGRGRLRRRARLRRPARGLAGLGPRPRVARLPRPARRRPARPHRPRPRRASTSAATVPLPLQADGEDLGDVTEAQLRGRARRADRPPLSRRLTPPRSRAPSGRG